MKLKGGWLSLTLLVATTALPAQTPQTIRVTTETALAGSAAQLKIELTAPQPISSGSSRFSTSLEDPWGIAVFSPNGDALGTAVLSAGTVDLNVISPKGTFGSVLDYPIITATVPVPATAVNGQMFPASLSPNSQLLTLFGTSLPLELTSGGVVVGGSLAITNVIPGGGQLPGGSTIRILGVGFNAKTKIRINEVGIQSMRVISPNEIQVTIKKAATLDGKLIVASNPDNSVVQYYSYQRGIPVGAPANPLLAATVPLFSTLTNQEGILPPTVSPLNSNYLTALAIQNPYQFPVSIQAQMYSGKNLLGTAKFQLPAGGRITRELSELFGTAPTLNSYVHIQAGNPVEMMGMLASQSAQTVAPLVVNAIAPGSFKP